MTDKVTVRKNIRLQRDLMISDEVLNLSQAIEDRLFACKEFLVCQDVVFYLSFRNEVHTDEMITRSLENQQRVYVPRLVERERRLELREITNMSQKFELDRHGIREPFQRSTKEVSPEKVAAVIAPGLAFDYSGGRVGFGGGYFDWLLKRLPEKALRLAVAYEFQVLNSVPQDPWDERVQKIFTENNTITAESPDG